MKPSELATKLRAEVSNFPIRAHAFYSANGNTLILQRPEIDNNHISSQITFTVKGLKDQMIRLRFTPLNMSGGEFLYINPKKETIVFLGCEFSTYEELVEFKPYTNILEILSTERKKNSNS
jgi:hypothetical protein